MAAYTVCIISPWVVQYRCDGRALVRAMRLCKYMGRQRPTPRKESTMKNVLFTCALCMIIGFAVIAAHQPAWAKPQTLCPVMGYAINKKIFVDHNGKRVYFCCNGCPETFKKEPDKYIKKLAAEGVELEAVPVQAK